MQQASLRAGSVAMSHRIQKKAACFEIEGKDQTRVIFFVCRRPLSLTTP